MSRFDFDTPIERLGTGSAKWMRFGPDVIPAWVADMDFASPPAVLDALRARVDHGVFGYASQPAELSALILARLDRLYGWKVEPDWLVPLPGVVPSLYFACQLAGDAGDSVVINAPYYHHLKDAPAYAGRRLQPVEGRAQEGRWELDLGGLSERIDARARLFLLCNPYNPVGRVLTRAELDVVASACIERDLVICSDEIHCDLVLDADRVHVPIATLGAEVADRTITLMAPSKTFNLPGVGGFAFAVIPNAGLRSAFLARARGVSTHPGSLAYDAAVAAYRDCADWQADLVDYLSRNRDLLEREVADIDGLSMTHVESTYLAWIDFGESGLADVHADLVAAGVGLTDGATLGDPTHMRLNFGCPRSRLEQILARIRSALT